MTIDPKSTDEKRSLALSAYHDGELSRLGRWRVERQLRRSTALRRELAELEKLAGVIREIESPPDSLETPDPWFEIGPALSAIDREIDAERNKGIFQKAGQKVGQRVGQKTGSNREAATSRTGKGMIWGALAASGALAVLVLALVVDNQGVILEDSTQDTYGEIAGGSLRYLRTNGVSYVVSQDSKDVTIIWLMDADGAAEGA
ncbi:MAG: hypothetical protein JRG89_06195 [Deltaproteobacteria bacterium]|nr:hypothetical protein [Deltaproteobacteria bacterium]MBW2724747.1 hypothetical protein [Deltaproteobacteria bacterium]